MAQTAHVIIELTKKGVPNKISWENKHQAALDKLIYWNHTTALNPISSLTCSLDVVRVV